MRHRGLRSQITNHKLPVGQRGYMMITLMLFLALIAIGLLAVLPEIGQQIKRDREDEMRHRGTAYMRAIQHFYKKFGRYPTKVEELEDTNNLRFLRKRYTDPMSVDRSTGKEKEKDFKFLHQQDILLNTGPVLGQTPGQSGFGGQGGQQGPGGFGGALGGMQGALGGLGAQPGGLQPNANSGSQTTASGGASNSSGNSSDEEENSSSAGSSSSNSNSGSSNAGSSSSGSTSGSGFNGPTFGGGPILGVASTSKAKSIRVFYDKNHYNDWLFIYLPQADVGGLLKGPVSPNGPTNTFTGGPGQSVMGGQIGGPGQGQAPNGGPPQGITPPQPPQNQSQTPPE